MSTAPGIEQNPAVRGRRRCRRVEATRRRGRVVALSAVAVFALAQLASTFLLDYVVPGIRFPALAKVNEQLRTSPRRPEIVVVGSSHLQTFQSDLADAVLARQFGELAPTTFNASVEAGDPVIWERVLSDWSRRDYFPRLLLIEVSPEMLNRNDIWLIQQSMRLLNWTDFVDVAPPLCSNGNIMLLLNDRFAPLHLHRYQIRKKIADSLFAEARAAEPAPSSGPVTIPETDPVPPSLSPVTQDKIREATAVVRRFVKNYSPHGVSADRLERLLEYCQRHGIRAVLYTAPFTSGYRAGYSPDCQAKFDSYMKSLRDRFGYDFIDWRTELADEYFFDSNHLNADGSLVMSRRMAQEILVPAWREVRESQIDRMAARRSPQ